MLLNQMRDGDFFHVPDQQSHHINQFLHIDLSDINFMLDGMTLKSGHEYEEH